MSFGVNFGVKRSLNDCLTRNGSSQECKTKTASMVMARGEVLLPLLIDKGRAFLVESSAFLYWWAALLLK